MCDNIKNMKKILYVVVTVLLVGVGVFCLFQKPFKKNTVVEKVNSGVINSVTFSCSENKSIQALFYSDKVELSLSDKRSMLLLQAMSASGARYANSDESFVFWNKGDTAFIDEGNRTTFKDCLIVTKNPVDSSTKNDISPNELANPASVNCTKLGGNLVINKRGDGGEYGLCYFEENRACEEWALMRGDCPFGGRKTTGYDGIDQNYCAWLGGETFAVPNSICTFKNGSKCSTLDLYNGKCFK